MNKEIYQERAIAYLKSAEQMIINAGYELNSLSPILAEEYLDLKLKLSNFRLKVQGIDLKEASQK